MKPPVNSAWWKALQEDFDTISHLVAGGMCIKDIIKKWDDIEIRPDQIYTFVSYHKLKPESVPGMRIIKSNDIRDRAVRLDGTSYCLHSRGDEPYIMLPISEYKALIKAANSGDNS